MCPGGDGHATQGDTRLVVSEPGILGNPGESPGIRLESRIRLSLIMEQTTLEPPLPWQRDRRRPGGACAACSQVLRVRGGAA